MFIKKYAVHHQYGVVESSKPSYNKALSILDPFLSQDPDFDEDKVVEGNKWWFFPNGWIGVIGYIIEKETGRVFRLAQT